MWKLKQGDIERLNSPRRPHLHLYYGDYMTLKEELERVKIRPILLDGSSMTTLEDMIEEFRKCLEFPDHYGRNLNALRESLGDMSWLGRKNILLLVKDVQKVKDSEVNEVLISYLKDTAIDWAIPADATSGFSRLSTPFNVVFHVNNKDSSEEFAQKLDKYADAGYWDTLNNYWNTTE